LTSKCDLDLGGGGLGVLHDTWLYNYKHAGQIISKSINGWKRYGLAMKYTPHQTMLTLSVTIVSHDKLSYMVSFCDISKSFDEQIVPSIVMYNVDLWSPGGTSTMKLVEIWLFRMVRPLNLLKVCANLFQSPLTNGWAELWTGQTNETYFYPHPFV
jgi:hypothetical protein